MVGVSWTEFNEFLQMMAKQQDQTFSREALAEAFRYQQDLKGTVWQDVTEVKSRLKQFVLMNYITVFALFFNFKESTPRENQKMVAASKQQ
jgi:hypothetical protein